MNRKNESEQQVVEFLQSTYQKNLVEQSSMKEAVYITLKEGILSARLSEELTENQVSTALHISRTPVREAMHKLEMEGLLEISHGKKAKITELSRKDAADIAVVLRSLHGLAAELFIKNATEKDEQRLEEIMALVSFYVARNDIHRAAELLTEFHWQTAVASGNKWLADTVERLLSFTALHREYALSRPGRIEISLKEHMAILDALCARDSDKAQELLRNHIDSAFDPAKFRVN